jgi:hypothetical protein
VIEIEERSFDRFRCLRMTTHAKKGVGRAASLGRQRPRRQRHIGRIACATKSKATAPSCPSTLPREGSQDKKLAAALRTRTAGSQDESPCRAFHRVNCFEAGLRQQKRPQMRYAPERCRAQRGKSHDQWKSRARNCREAVDQINGSARASGNDEGEATKMRRRGLGPVTAEDRNFGSADARWRGRGYFEFRGAKKMNAQCLSPVGRWAFYTVICTALCGTLTQGNASWLAAVRSWFGLADGIFARSAPRCKGQHGTNRDIKGLWPANRGQIAWWRLKSGGHTRSRRLEEFTA